ncbi:hypothetical protein QYM36_002615 [Artemia franciscana]|uniref:Uncharacterized protein n=1 Tax=Artemia franciscana TaxID=6661 RepID=A0AA88I913_ARTSF|nr:hypothetical protein QYM36_002615 [Artemia franciscana]
MERLKQQVKKKVTETKAKTGTAELEKDVLELTTKITGMQSHVHELKSRVIPEYKLRNSKMKEELVKTIQNKMAAMGTHTIAAKGFTEIIYQNSVLLQDIRQYKPAVPQLPDAGRPSEFWSLKIKEVQLLLSSFENLLTTQQ